MRPHQQRPPRRKDVGSRSMGGVECFAEMSSFGQKSFAIVLMPTGQEPDGTLQGEVWTNHVNTPPLTHTVHFPFFLYSTTFFVATDRDGDVLNTLVSWLKKRVKSQVAEPFYPTAARSHGGDATAQSHAAGLHSSSSWRRQPHSSQCADAAAAKAAADATAAGPAATRCTSPPSSSSLSSPPTLSPLPASLPPSHPPPLHTSPPTATCRDREAVATAVERQMFRSY